MLGTIVSAPATLVTGAVTLIRPVGRGSVQSLYQYSPSRSNLNWNDWPGCTRPLNKPSKNCVAQCSLVLPVSPDVLFAPGFRNVTVVPTGTPRLFGNIAVVPVASFAAVAAALVRASRMVLFTVLPAVGVPPPPRRMTSGALLGNSPIVPPSLNAHMRSPSVPPV